MNVAPAARRLALSTALPAILCVMLAGCGAWTETLTFGGPKGRLSIQADTPTDAGPKIEGRFDTAVYAADDEQTLHALLIEGPPEDPTQVVHIRMFWKPMAGRTPFDPSATNSSVRYIVFREGQVGFYGGGGLMQPRDTPGEKRFEGTLRNATLRLLDATEGFDAEPIGINALSEGQFDAELDRVRTLRLLRQVSQVLEDRLGYPRMVGAIAALSEADDEASVGAAPSGVAR